MAGEDSIRSSEPKKPGAVKVFNCPDCGAGVTLRALGQAMTAVCASCGAIIDSSNENFKVLEKAAKKGIRHQVIPLGQRGKLHGVLWEVIGYMERVDGSSAYTWSEYLLFNPLKGFRWLTEFDGHWNYILTTKSKPEEISEGRERAIYLNKEYFLFHRGTAKVSYVIGEFYWRVKQGEKVAVRDYVSPPEILSSEKSENEIIWSLGQYVEASEIKSAFLINEAMPRQSGVAPNQVSTVSDTATSVGKIWTFFILILVLIQFATLFLATNRTVFSGVFNYSPKDSERLKVTPQFEISSGMSNLQVTISSPVQNSWVEIQSDLVNDETGEIQEFEQGVEFYSGYDSDGPWQEGSQISSTVLSSIPAGKYHLNIDASGPALPALQPQGTDSLSMIDPSREVGAVQLRMEIKRNVPIWSNFFWAIGLVSLFPIFIFWRRRSFEMDRWSQSDFSPYYSEQEE